MFGRYPIITHPIGLVDLTMIGGHDTSNVDTTTTVKGLAPAAK